MNRFGSGGGGRGRRGVAALAACTVAAALLAGAARPGDPRPADGAHGGAHGGAHLGLTTQCSAAAQAIATATVSGGRGTKGTHGVEDAPVAYQRPHQRPVTSGRRDGDDGSGSDDGSGGGAVDGSSAVVPATVVGAPEELPFAYVEPAGVSPVTLQLDRQLPMTLWTEGTLTVRLPVRHGTVRLAVTTKGFSTISLATQRWSDTGRRWLDVLGHAQGGAPVSDVLSFPLTAPHASAAHPVRVRVRFQAVDRPGTVTLVPVVADGPGHSFGGRSVSSQVTRPQTTLSGWPGGTVLRRGGAFHPFTLTLRNTTDRRYDSLNAVYYAYGQTGRTVLTGRDLELEQLVGRAWVRLALTDHCDPGLSAVLRDSGGRSLAPGRSLVYRLRLRALSVRRPARTTLESAAVAAAAAAAAAAGSEGGKSGGQDGGRPDPSAPERRGAASTQVQAGLLMSNGSSGFDARTLAFTVR